MHSRAQPLGSYLSTGQALGCGPELGCAGHHTGEKLTAAVQGLCAIPSFTSTRISAHVNPPPGLLVPKTTRDKRHQIRQPGAYLIQNSCDHSVLRSILLYADDTRAAFTKLFGDFVVRDGAADHAGPILPPPDRWW